MTTAILPQGAVAVREAVLDFFQTSMPGIIALAREHWDLTKYELPDIAKYDTYDPLAIDTYPFLGCAVLGSRANPRIGYDDQMQQEYAATYDLKVYVYVLTPQDSRHVWMQPEYRTTIALRDRLLVLARMLVLNQPSLGNPNFVVDEKSLVEDYLEPMRKSDQNPQWTCGGVLSCTVAVTEQTSLPNVGTASTMTLTATANSLD